ncbi:unnamed protein product [Mycena citricolor]|uniref:Uncharacterized protein n=1 Tax=Mycena citricolor TaxID=2018698 RepID=A0AAD2HJ63_9AGAR|nr:unnamed protein product [Mycena citricolor]
MPLLAPSSPPPSSATSRNVELTPVTAPEAISQPPVPPDSKPDSTVARLTLDLDGLSAEIAGELATSLVGHVLFLKNQIPFPVAQLARIPGTKSAPKALKHRTDLLAAFDTLGSHLITTFAALSTALALVDGGPVVARPPRKGYLAVLVGPSVGAAKTKVMYAVDGLVTKVWGEREDEFEGDDNDDSDSEGEEEDGDISDSDSSDDDSRRSDDEEAPPSDTEDDPHTPPPDSRSPSPSLQSSPPPSQPAPAPIPTLQESTQQVLRSANRQLSHTLATAEHSMSCELAPTQIHILLRAPRRFKHPAWVPRQTTSAGLDATLREFREEAGDVVAATSRTRAGKSRGAKPEGLWLTCRNPGVDFAEPAEGTPEEDEMIWWSWDGKLAGFADW